MTYKSQGLLAITLGFYLFSLTSPFLFWSDRAVYIIYPILLIIINFKKIDLSYIKKNSFIILTSMLFFNILIYIPPIKNCNIEYLNIIIFLSAVLIIFTPLETKQKAVYFFINMMVTISIFTIISYIFLLMDINWPQIIINSPGRSDITLIGPGSLYLPSQEYSFFNSRLYRLNGVYKEPGHYAIYLAFALAFISKPLRSYKGLILIISLLMTGSTTSFIFITTIILIKHLNKEELFIAILIILIFLLVFLSFDSTSILFDNYFFKKIHNGSFQKILDYRARHSEYNLQYFPDFLEYFYGFPGTLDSKYITSDYRSLYFHVGYLGIISFLLLIAAINSKEKNNNKIIMSVSAIIFIVFLHRSWMLEQGFVWILLAILISLPQKKLQDISSIKI